MICDTFDFAAAEEFYSFGNAGLPLDGTGKRNLPRQDSDQFGLTSSLFEDLELPEVLATPDWLTERYDLVASDVAGDILPTALDLLDQAVDLNDASASTSPCCSTSSFEAYSLSPSASEDGLFFEAQQPPTVPQVTVDADVQSLMDIIGIATADNDAADTKSPAAVGPIRPATVSDITTTVTPYPKTSPARRKSRKTVEQKTRKKKQNRNAATRYRIKKKDEFSELFGEATALEKVNGELKGKVDGLQTEIDYLKSLMLDVIKARLAGKNQGTTTSQNASIVITNSTLVQAS